MGELMQWQMSLAIELSAEFVAAVRTHLPDAEAQGVFAATLLWQRGWRDLNELAGFLDADRYQPTSPFAFGEEMQRAIDRLLTACAQAESVAIWGDFDADGITATAVLWEGLGQFFPSDRLTYTIPNRLHESHGLSIAGLDRLAAQGVSLIVTCDTGSTNPAELEYAQAIGLDVIITDHHTLPAARPPVTAILNPRALPVDHPLAHLSGVAVAYKLVEALYATLPDRVDRPLTDLLDLVAIGLIADLVQLRGDCRYLAQRGLVQLQQQSNPLKASRPGIARLLELCKRSGDRPTDISFGIGPRINAISRIHGDARFGVELLTSRDRNRCRQLADETELANTRRKALQKDLLHQVQVLLAQIDLSTTSVIVLSDPQWPIGILGLVAGQIAQQYGRPTILLSEEVAASDREPLARGSARSIGAIDLYELVQDQADLLHSFGGHPFAAGLSLPVANIGLFRSAVNQALRRQNLLAAPIVTADLTVTVADLGGLLFRELRLLEPYGMGNPPPRLLIRNCWFREVQTEKIQDWKGGKVRYSKVCFKICDETGEFPGVWWEHTPADLPPDRCDAIAELDNNPYQKRYEIRLIAVRSIATIAIAPAADWLLDWRIEKPIDPPAAVLELPDCPHSWQEFHQWAIRARQTGRSLALAYSLPFSKSAEDLWQDWIGLAKFLSRTGERVERSQLQTKFNLGDSAFACGLDSLSKIGFQVAIDPAQIAISLDESIEPDWTVARQAFVAAVREEQFRQQYFCQVDPAILQAALQQAALQQAVPQ